MRAAPPRSSHGRSRDIGPRAIGPTSVSIGTRTRIRSAQDAVQDAVTPVAAPVPWKPNSADAAASSEPFQFRLDTDVPFRVPPQTVLMDVPDGRLSATLQPLIAELPAV